MEQLIVIKQRIKTVETIRKVTHAMRLVSMSTHSRLLEKKKELESYKVASTKIIDAAKPHLAAPAPSPLSHELFILISSHKGLCGTFNSSLARFFERQVPHLPSHAHYIGIGTFAINYLEKRKVDQQASYPIVSASNFVTIPAALADQISSSPITYNKITVFSMKEKSFFVQVPQEVVIYPHASEASKIHPVDVIKYRYEQAPKALNEAVQRLVLTVSLQELLFQSLLAEQAARFISMDSSTRNADSLITTMKLGYNKVRQASITRELTELSATL